MKVIGLTGGIGSGKSTVARLLADWGAAVIHADAVGHEVYAPGTLGWRQVTAAFGTGILAADGTIDRQRLGAIVFADPQARARLDAIVHPLIAAEIQRRVTVQRAAHAAQIIVVEAALLIEANWRSLVDEVWLVVADTAAVVDRVVSQRGLSASEVTLRIAAQISDAQRRQVADVVIENTGSLEQLEARVRAAWTAATEGNV